MKLYTEHGDTFYAVRESTGILFCESPDEQGLSDKEPQESVLRLFMTRQGAQSYCDFISESHGDAAIQAVSLRAIWDMLPRIDNVSMKKNNCPVKVEVCGIDDDGWPVTVDVLHSIFCICS